MQCILIWLSFFFGKLNKYSLGICGSQDPTNIYNIPWGKKIHSIFQVVPCSIGIKDDHITVCQLNLSLLPYIINSYYIYIYIYSSGVRTRSNSLGNYRVDACNVK